MATLLLRERKQEGFSSISSIGHINNYAIKAEKVARRLEIKVYIDKS